MINIDPVDDIIECTIHEALAEIFERGYAVEGEYVLGPLLQWAKAQKDTRYLPPRRGLTHPQIIVNLGAALRWWCERKGIA